MFRWLITVLVLGTAARAQDSPHGALRWKCTECHSTKGWNEVISPMTFDHASTSFVLYGQHRSAECRQCHPSLRFSVTPAECAACHQRDADKAVSIDHRRSAFGSDCVHCHRADALSWKASFDHNRTQFPTRGIHEAVPCSGCHTNGIYRGTNSECAACHMEDYNAASQPNHVAARFPTDCATCHRALTWQPAVFFPHQQYFPIGSGDTHRPGRWNQCTDCHTASPNYTLFECISCHEHARSSTDRHHGEVSGYVYQSDYCYRCHPAGNAEEDVRRMSIRSISLYHVRKRNAESVRRYAVRRSLLFVIWSIIVGSMVTAQELTELRYGVSYVAASVVYINAGREGNIAVGDTVSIYRGTVQIGTVLVTAVSKRSSAAQVLSQTVPMSAGDGAVLFKAVEKKEIPAIPSAAAAPFTSDSAASAVVAAPVPADRTENIVTGRVSLQYLGTLAEISALDLSQPSTVLRLNIQNLYNTGLVFSMYGRTYYDLTDIYARYGDNNRLKNRIYDFSLQTADPSSVFGYGVGRLSSEYVGGMGTFDGGQFFVRQDNITTGFLYGAKVQDRTIGVNTGETKGAFFVNARYGSDFLHQYSGTLAYGRQLVRKSTDREFLYLQNFLMLGPALSLYESSEFELNDIQNGVKRKTFKLSNTFFSVNYYPAEWISTNVGYDGSRSVYLFESMKSFSDTLLDKNIMQGYRAGATVRLPYFMSLSGNLSYRTKKGDARNARTLSGSCRISDLLQTEIGAGIRYADIVGVYSDGTNITVDVDRTFFNALSLAARYDYYQYTVLTLQQTYTTQTVTVNSSYRFSRSIYSSLAVDGVLDDTMNSLRIYAEIGYRF